MILYKLVNKFFEHKLKANIKAKEDILKEIEDVLKKYDIERE